MDEVRFVGHPNRHDRPQLPDFRGQNKLAYMKKMFRHLLAVVVLATATVSATIKVDFVTWNSAYSTNEGLKSATHGVQYEDADVIFFCEQEHEAAPVVGSSKWVKVFLAGSSQKGDLEGTSYSHKFSDYDSSLSGETGGWSLFGAGGATKTTSTVISVAVDSVRGPITVKKEEQFQNGNRNGKGFIGGRYKITRNNKHAYIGVGCAHMPTDSTSDEYQAYVTAFQAYMDSSDNEKVDLWVFYGDLNNRLTSTDQGITDTDVAAIAGQSETWMRKLTGGEPQTVNGKTWSDPTRDLARKMDMKSLTVDKLTYKFKEDGSFKEESSSKVKHAGVQAGGLDRVFYKEEAKSNWIVTASPSKARGTYGSDHQLVETLIALTEKPQDSYRGRQRQVQRPDRQQRLRRARAVQHILAATQTGNVH